MLGLRLLTEAKLSGLSETQLVLAYESQVGLQERLDVARNIVALIVPI